MSEDRNLRSSVAVAQLLFAERGVDPTGKRAANPDHRPEQDDGKDKLKRGNHESVSTIPYYTQTVIRAINSQ